MLPLTSAPGDTGWVPHTIPGPLLQSVLGRANVGLVCFSYKTETRSSGRKGPISFGLGWGGGGGAGGVGGWDLEVQGARKSKSGRLLSGSVPSGVGSGTSAKSEGEMCRFPSGLRIPLLFWLL